MFAGALAGVAPGGPREKYDGAEKANGEARVGPPDPAGAAGAAMGRPAKPKYAPALGSVTLVLPMPRLPNNPGSSGEDE